MADNSELYRALLRVSHLLRHGHGEPELKMAPGQQRVLTVLSRHDSLSQRDLLEEMGLARATLSELLTRLEEKGLIERARSKADRRVIIVSLTKKGKVASKKVIDIQSGIADEAFAPLSASQKDDMKAMLDAVLQSWDS
ncbi:MAG: MarR family transcriptional regulator [Eggerthellaceae bacterium]|nr:MarR family transcriptional regulator [Eggerthellaceae bacterium]